MTAENPSQSGAYSSHTESRFKQPRAGFDPETEARLAGVQPPRTLEHPLYEIIAAAVEHPDLRGRREIGAGDVESDVPGLDMREVEE